MTILECLQILIDRPDCDVASTEGLPQLASGAELPPSLVEFYTACGG